MDKLLEILKNIELLNDEELKMVSIWAEFTLQKRAYAEKSSVRQNAVSS